MSRWPSQSQLESNFFASIKSEMCRLCNHTEGDCRCLIFNPPYQKVGEPVPTYCTQCGDRMESVSGWRLGCIAFACLSAGLAVAHLGIPDVFKSRPKLDMLPRVFMDDVRSHLEAGGTVVTHIGGGLGGTTVEVQRGR